MIPGNRLTYRAEPKIDFAAGQISIDEFTSETSLLDAAVDVLKNHTRQVIETRDRIVRDALIRLGWTPPPDVPRSVPIATECSDDARLRARASDPASSVRAADAAAKFAGSHKERILKALGDFELSTLQVAHRSGLTVVQVDRRVIELERERQIEVLRLDGRDVERLGYRVLRRFRTA